MCVRDLLSFFTILPLGGRGLGFSCLWALPYLGAAVVGGAGAFAFYLTGDGRVAYIALLAATGLNHVDGLADVADALMVRDRGRARAVLEDPHRGAAAVFAVSAAVLLGASAHVDGWWDYILADSYSKALTVVAAAFSKPFKPGLGAEFITHARRQWPAALPALALAAWLNPRAFAVATAAALLLYAAAYRHLGGANGDIFGFLLEISRVAYLYP
ncbi:adenosylcobinamide-GDP ribazoletransferase [Pyrobaculum sp.]|uniref:adenosylcobinamide-GDP ribazoletransferase n=1 Tax=Pyrobaculum sp. TaxID=2004705 RepID=UPI003D0C9463